MHRILEELLSKRKVKVEDLDPEEYQQFDRWEKILSTEGEITVKNIEEFCKNQVSILKAQMKNLDNSGQKNERAILLFTVYDTLLDVISAPESEKEKLEKYLYGLLDV